MGLAKVAKTPYGSAPTSHADAADLSHVWLPAIVRRIAGHLPENEVACTLRLVCKATAQQFADRTTVRPAQPVPRWCFAPECRRVCQGLTLEKRRRLVCLTAASGDVANLEAAAAETGCPLGPDAMAAAGGAGKLAGCQWLVESGRVPWEAPWAHSVVRAAVAGGHDHVVDWGLGLQPAVFRGTTIGSSTFVDDAFRHGREALAWRLLEARPVEGTEQWVRLVEGAAEGCSLACLKRVWEGFRVEQRNEYRLGLEEPEEDEDEEEDMPDLPFENDDHINDDVLGKAGCSLTNDWKEKFQFLESKGFSPNERTCACVLASGSLSGSAGVERLAWLQGRGAELTEGLLTTAASRGDAVVVAYLLGQGLMPTKQDLLAAAGAGSIETVQALLAAGISGKRKLVGAAEEMAIRGRLAALPGLVETYGAAAFGGLGPGLFRCAAASGDAAVIAWLLERGCAVDEAAWGGAAESGCEAALELLSERGCPKPADGGPYAAAAKAEDVRTMAVLRRLDVSYGPDGGQGLFTRVAGGFSMSVSDARCALQVLPWLQSNGCRADWGEAEKAAKKRLTWGGPGEVLAWLTKQQAA